MRAVSIHVGVNRPGGRFAGRPLEHSESLAWRMAGLAEQAGYDALTVLRGEAATRAALHEALTAAAGSLRGGDQLLLTFSGHGTQVRDLDCDEGHGWDEGWCLSDGVLLDDRLAGYWLLFERGVRIVVVADSCYAAGSMREDESPDATPPVGGIGMGRYRGTEGQTAPANHSGSCIPECPRNTYGIQASLLLLSAAGEDQTARENLFAQHLLGVWNNGAFQGSYCDLHRQVRERVMTERDSQEPHILMLGVSDHAFPLETAFHLDRRHPGGFASHR